MYLLFNNNNKSETPLLQTSSFYSVEVKIQVEEFSKLTLHCVCLQLWFQTITFPAISSLNPPQFYPSQKRLVMSYVAY